MKTRIVISFHIALLPAIFAYMKVLTEKRISLYCNLLIFLYVILGVVYFKHAYGPEKWFNDFVEYQAAGMLAADGKAAQVYDRTVLRELQRTLADENSVDLRFSYPPIYLLYLAPLMLLSEPISFFFFSVLPFLLFIAILKKTVPHRLTVQVALAFPAVVMNFYYGQNGFTSAALLGGGLLLLDSHPAISAILMGLLCYKPNIALICPVLLLFSKRYKELFIFTATVVTTCLLSFLCFGLETWEAFIANLGAVFEAVREMPEILYRMGTLFAALKLLHVPESLAMTIHTIVMTSLLGLACYLWYKKPSNPLVKSATATIAMLMTPYLFEYDLILLSLSIAWFYEGTRHRELTHNERSILLAAYIIPFLSRHIAQASNIVAAPVVLFMILTITVKNIFNENSTESPAETLSAGN